MANVFISICIPAYKRVDFLKRLLDSIAAQDYRDFEVVVTDDSPADEVRVLCENYLPSFNISYYKNEKQRGTPENWNEGLRKASGKWIKIMHDDDWFSRPDCLRLFADAATRNPGSFIFSWYTNVYFEENRQEKIKPGNFRLKQLKKDPLSLLSRNVIGPPSVTMHQNQPAFYYDPKLKWLVDIDFYNQRLETESFYVIEDYLVHVGLGAEQVTMMCHSNPEIEIPENKYLLAKTGTRHLKNLFIYDAWWRLFRNLNIKSESQLKEYSNTDWPAVIYKILKDVNRIPGRMLRFGVLSKLLMSVSYLKNRSSLK